RFVPLGWLSDGTRISTGSEVGSRPSRAGSRGNRFNRGRGRGAVRSVELFLLEGTYQTRDDGVVVELFGRTREGQPLVARYYGFRPYFVLTEPTEETRSRLKADPEIIGLDETSVWLGG